MHVKVIEPEVVRYRPQPPLPEVFSICPRPYSFRQSFQLFRRLGLRVIVLLALEIWPECPQQHSDSPSDSTLLWFLPAASILGCLCCRSFPLSGKFLPLLLASCQHSLQVFALRCPPLLSFPLCDWIRSSYMLLNEIIPLLKNFSLYCHYWFTCVPF